MCRGDCVRLAWCEELQVLRGSECSKGERQAPRCVILVRGSENGRDVRSHGGAGGSVRERHGSRCVLPLLRRRYPSVCVPRGMWNETGNGVARSLQNASPDTADRSTSSPTLGIGKTTTRFPGLPPTKGDVDRVLSTRCAFLRTSGMSGTLNLQSRSSFNRFVSGPKVMSSNLNCRSFQWSEHREELQCQVEEDTAEKRVSKTVKILLVTSLGRCDGRSTAGVCAFRVIDRGKIEARLPSRMCPCSNGKASGIASGLGTWEKQQGARECSTMRQVDKLMNATITTKCASPDGCGVRSGGEGGVDY